MLIPSNQNGLHTAYKKWGHIVFLILFIVTFSFCEVKAQEIKIIDSNISFYYSSGSLIAHTKNLSHVTRGFTHGFSVYASNLIPMTTKMEDRKQLTMLDLGMHYIHFPIKSEGQIIGITLGKTGTIARFGKASLIGQFAPGFGYSTNPYSKENNKNLNISTHIGLFVHSNLSLNFPIYKNWNGLFAVGFNHLSNASIQRPNYGYNTLSTIFGASYLIKQNKVPVKNEKYDSSRKYYYHLFGSYFKTSSGYWAGERQNSYGLHAQIERNISTSHSILLGCDYNYRKELHPLEKPIDEDSDNLAHYLGISAGASWKFGIIDLNASFGTYLLKPWTYSKTTYSLLHSKTYFLKNYYLLIGIKAHKFRAELFEAGIGVKL